MFVSFYMVLVTFICIKKDNKTTIFFTVLASLFQFCNEKAFLCVINLSQSSFTKNKLISVILSMSMLNH